MHFPHGETVTRLRAVVSTDPYSGEPIGLDWSTPGELAIEGCGFDPGGSIEPLETGRHSVVTTPVLYAPPSVDVLAGDRIRRNATGRVYDVIGEPAEYLHPFTGWAPGVEVRLRIVEG